jgi:hypothetical protein
MPSIKNVKRYCPILTARRRFFTPFARYLQRFFGTYSHYLVPMTTSGSALTLCALVGCHGLFVGCADAGDKLPAHSRLYGHKLGSISPAIPPYSPAVGTWDVKLEPGSGPDAECAYNLSRCSSDRVTPLQKLLSRLLLSLC